MTLTRFAMLLILSVASFGTLTSINLHAAEPSPEAASYDASADAGTQVEDALVRARASGKRILLVLGANWCHDSRALAGWLETPRLKQLVADKYELVFVEVGSPQTGEGRNLDIAERYGIEIEGTPTVLVLSPEGELLNPKRAKRWSNAASRNEEEIYDELAEAAG